MSDQHRYRVTYTNEVMGRWDWETWTGQTWQEAIHNWTSEWISPHTVLSEIPSEDGRSGVLVIQEARNTTWRTIWLIRSTFIDCP